MYHLCITCVIDSPSTIAYYLDLSNFISESGLSYDIVLTICLLLVYFVSGAGCHCFDLYLKLCFSEKFLFQEGAPTLQNTLKKDHLYTVLLSLLLNDE